MKRPLCVITCHFNPCGYERPRENLFKFATSLPKHVDAYLTELTFDGSVGHSYQHCMRWNVFKNVWVRTANSEKSMLWQKEALLNHMIRILAPDYDAIAWIDADVLFMNMNWTMLAFQELEHAHVAQLFSDAWRMDKESEMEHAARSFGWHWSTRAECSLDLNVSHPGYAWVARSDFLLRHLLYDRCVTGCGDSAMLRGWTGSYPENFVGDVGERMTRDIDGWADAVFRDTFGEVGFVMGALVHMYHGEVKDRRNRERREFLRELDPREDLILNDAGILEWTPHALRNKGRLIKGVADYFTSRREDGIMETS